MTALHAGGQGELSALLDPVTRLPGRDLFLDRCAVALVRARRARVSIGIVVVSVAALDSAEDAERDRIRRRVAAAVASVVRAEDTIARFENRFVVLCNTIRSDRDLAAATARLSNVLRHCDGRAVATLVEASVTPHELLALVDAS